MKNNNLLLLALAGGGLYWFLTQRRGLVAPTNQDLPFVTPQPGLPADIPHTPPIAQGSGNGSPVFSNGRLAPDQRDPRLQGTGNAYAVRCVNLVN